MISNQGSGISMVISLFSYHIKCSGKPVTHPCTDKVCLQWHQADLLTQHGCIHQDSLPQVHRVINHPLNIIHLKQKGKI